MAYLRLRGPLRAPTRPAGRPSWSAIALAGAILLTLAPTASATGPSCTSLGTCLELTVWSSVSGCTALSCIVEIGYDAKAWSAIGLAGFMRVNDSAGGGFACAWTLASSCGSTHTSRFLVPRGSTAQFDVYAEACSVGAGSVWLDCVSAHESRRVSV